MCAGDNKHFLFFAQLIWPDFCISNVWAKAQASNKKNPTNFGPQAMFITPLNFDHAFSPFQQIRGVCAQHTVDYTHRYQTKQMKMHDFTPMY